MLVARFLYHEICCARELALSRDEQLSESPRRSRSKLLRYRRERAKNHNKQQQKSTNRVLPLLSLPPCCMSERCQLLSSISAATTPSILFFPSFSMKCHFGPVFLSKWKWKVLRRCVNHRITTRQNFISLSFGIFIFLFQFSFQISFSLDLKNHKKNVFDFSFTFEPTLVVWHRSFLWLVGEIALIEHAQWRRREPCKARPPGRIAEQSTIHLNGEHWLQILEG